MKVLKNCFLFFTVFCLSFIAELLPLSLKNVSSWVFNHKEECFYQEYPLEHTGTVVVKQISGAITIKTWSQPKIVIEAIKIAREKDIQKCAIETTATEQHVLIQTHCNESVAGTVDYVIMMPQKANLIIEAEQSDIIVKSPKGAINIVLESGTIDIRHAHNTIYAKNDHGPITISSKMLVDPHMISLEAQGSIILSIPLTINASLQAKAPQGTVESEHFVMIKSFKAKLNQQTWDQCRREVFGTLGTGGPKIKLHTHSGNIKLIEY